MLTGLAVFGAAVREAFVPPVFGLVVLLALVVQVLRWPRQEEKAFRLMANNLAFYAVMGICIMGVLQMLILGGPRSGRASDTLSMNLHQLSVFVLLGVSLLGLLLTLGARRKNRMLMRLSGFLGVLWVFGGVEVLLGFVGHSHFWLRLVALLWVGLIALRWRQQEDRAMQQMARNLVFAVALLLQSLVGVLAVLIGRTLAL